MLFFRKIKKKKSEVSEVNKVNKVNKSKRIITVFRTRLQSIDKPLESILAIHAQRRVKSPKLSDLKGRCYTILGNLDYITPDNFNRLETIISSMEEEYKVEENRLKEKNLI